MERGFRPVIEGTASEPTFYKVREPVRKSPDWNPNALGPVTKVALIAVFGTLLFMTMRWYDTRNIKTGPELTVIPSYEADMSTLTNQITAVHNLTPAPVS